MPQSSPSRLFVLTSNPRLRRAAKIIAGLVFAYGVLGFFILPGIVRTQIEVRIAEKLHREASIGAVEINPYALTLTLRDFTLRERKSEAVFAAFDTLHLNLSSESLLRLAPVIRELRLAGPRIQLVRTAANRYNIDDIVELLASQPPSDEPARFSVNNIQVEGGRIAFDDRPAKALHAVDDITLGIPFVSSLPSQVDIFVEPLLRASVNGAPLEFKGKARPFAKPADATVDIRLDKLDLTRYIDYLPVKPQARIARAALDLNLSARFRQGGEGQGQALLLQGDAALKGLDVADASGKPVLRLQELAVELQEADVFAGRIALPRVRIDGLRAELARDANGRLNLARLLPPSAAAEKDTAKPLALHVDVGEIAVRGAALRYSDEHAAQPMRAAVDKFDLALRKLAVNTAKQRVDIGEIASGSAAVTIDRAAAEGDTLARPAPRETAPEKRDAGYVVNVATAGISNWSVRVEDRGGREPIVTTAAPVSLSVQGLSTTAASRARVDLKASVNESGSMAASGTLGIAPLHADLKLDIKDVDILPLQPFITDKVNLRATSANLSSAGRVQVDTGPDGKLRGGFKGDATLGNLATVDKAGNNDFLRWKSLHAGGVDVRFEPLAVGVDQLALSDFFARVIIDPAGRINLQDIVRGDDAPAAAAVDNGGKARPVPVVIKRVSLQGGRVRFTDNFIKPNYSASLTKFGGALSGLSSDPASRAEVDLRGEVNGAPLAVGGRINPLRGDLFLDIKANVRGMELAPLSAYSGKYVGYGIEKGKLSFEAGYRIDKRTLTAENRLVLEQLAFGDKVDSPEATSLPVQFAVALLADRNGVIDLNLPIAGSLDDPQFSIGAVIFKLIGNAITKAVTQPFALLGSLFGGGAELSSMAFDAGRASVPAAGEEKLRALARALAERPGLRLDIGGRADPEADREGLKRVSVERKVRGLKMRDLRARGAEVEPGSVTVSRDEYPDLLRRAYRDEKFPKPRNVLGLPKDLPLEEMEKLMAANAEIDEDELLALGNQRAQAVKNWLQRNGQVAPERMFITAAKIGAVKEGAALGRVDFALR